MTVPRFVFTMAMLAACGAGVVGSLWLRDDALGDTRPASAPLWSPVATGAAPIVETQNFNVERAAARPIPAPAWTGTVTAVAVSPGSVLDPGAPAPFAVDGIPRQWLASSTPLYRPVAKGAIGPDVDVVVAFVAAAGFTVDHLPGGPVTSTTVRAIRDWAVANGFGKSKTAFEPAWVTWLPTDQIGGIVASVEARLGEPVPAAGGKLLVTGSGPTGLAVRDQAGQLRLTPVAGTVDLIEIGGVEYPYSGGQLDEAGLAALSAVLPPEQTEVSLKVVHRFPDGAAAIPATALIPDGDAHCVVVSDVADGPTRATTEVAVLGASGGVAVVEGISGFVLANPGSDGVRDCR